MHVLPVSITDRICSDAPTDSAMIRLANPVRNAALQILSGTPKRFLPRTPTSAAPHEKGRVNHLACPPTSSRSNPSNQALPVTQRMNGPALARTFAGASAGTVNSTDLAIQSTFPAW